MVKEKENTEKRRKRNIREVSNVVDEDEEVNDEEQPTAATTSTLTRDPTSSSPLPASSSIVPTAKASSTSLLSRTTEYRIKKTLNFSTVSSQPLTKARMVACMDPRASYTWLVLNMALCSCLSSFYKFNMDPATIKVEDTGLLSVIKKCKEDSMPLSNLDLPLDTCIFIKWIHLTSAGGEMSDIVLHIAIDALSDDDFHKEYVTGLTHNIGYEGGGWILFSKTRGGNKGLWTWYYQNICIPTINCAKNRHNCMLQHYVENELVDTPMHAVLSTDGESLALESAMDVNILENFNKSNIYYVKISASTSAIHQACDRAPTFRCVKAGMDYISRNGTVIDDVPILENSVFEAFDGLVKNYPNASISKAFKDKVYHACLKLVWVFKNKYLTEEHIKKGFSICGQHRVIPKNYVDTDPSPQGLSYSSVDYKKIMAQCYYDIEESQLNTMITSLPQAINEIKSKGMLSEDFMNDQGIVKTVVGRDKLVLNRQYATILSHPEISGKFHGYLIDRFLATDPTEIKKRAEMKRLQSIVNKVEAAKEKQQAKDTKKEEAKNMTKAQKDESKRLKKVATDARNLLAAEKKALQLREYEEAKAKLASGVFDLPLEVNQPAVDVSDEEMDEEMDLD